MKIKIFWAVLSAILIAACGKNTPPSETGANTKSSEPVKQVDQLPTERLRAGAQTMNNASKLSEQLQQRAEETNDEADKQAEQ